MQGLSPAQIRSGNAKKRVAGGQPKPFHDDRNAMSEMVRAAPTPAPISGSASLSALQDDG